MVRSGISIVGTGNVAWHLGKALFESGERIDFVYGRDVSKAKDLARSLKAELIEDLTNLENRTVLICVKDEAIGEISEILHPSCFVIHTSGSVSINVLEGHEGFGVLYPLQTFSKDRNIELSSVPFLVEASDKAHLISIIELASRIAENIQISNSEERKQIHLAAVYVNNFTNHIIQTAKQLMDEKGLDWKLLLPLLKETVDKLTEMDPDEAQTGPAKRNDQITIQEHLSMLPESERELYEMISKRIQQHYLDKK
jgi:predicted short-subunit dehydrogenase-like oxidoreductase (DUF2520 family)